jgi:hypothetical protein
MHERPASDSTGNSTFIAEIRINEDGEIQLAASTRVFELRLGG